MADEYTTFAPKNPYVVFRKDSNGNKIYLLDNHGNKKLFPLYGEIFDVLGIKNEEEMADFGLFVEIMPTEKK